MRMRVMMGMRVIRPYPTAAMIRKTMLIVWMTTMSINKHKYLTTIMLCHTVLWMMPGDI